MQRRLNRHAEKHVASAPVQTCRVVLAGEEMWGLRAATNVSRDSIVASYPVELVPDATSRYAIEIANGNGVVNPAFVGDVSPRSLRHVSTAHAYPPIGMFANEPSPGETANAFFCTPRVVASQCVAGRVVEAFLVAACDIGAGGPVLFHYGDEYTRNYDVSDD